MAHVGRGTMVEGLVKIAAKKEVRGLLVVAAVLALPFGLRLLADWTRSKAASGAVAKTTVRSRSTAPLIGKDKNRLITFSPGEREKVVVLKGDDTTTAWVELPENADFRIDPPPDGCWVEFSNGRKIWSKPGEKFIIGQPIDGQLRFWGKGQVKIVIERQNPSPT